MKQPGYTNKWRCPHCGHVGCRVTDSRMVAGGTHRYRRLCCGSCWRRWTTYEMDAAATERYRRVLRTIAAMRRSKTKLLNAFDLIDQLDAAAGEIPAADASTHSPVDALPEGAP